MLNTKISSAAYVDTKPHYDILNGLRGVAAFMVVWFHIFEAFATSHVDQRINHGYLAVDFFFILSGFVIAYAYDDRWNTMTVSNFTKRRIIRLQPMVIMGAIIGAVMFYFQESNTWDVSAVTVGALLFATLLNSFMIPVTPAAEIRGLGEMYPLNGPTWSLLFEYIGCFLYALFIRKLSKRALTALVIIAGIFLAYFSIFVTGDICFGYSLTPLEFSIGLLRILFSFSAGLLLSRIFKPIKIRGAFWICSIALIAVFAFPRLGGEENLWMNGIYDTLCFALFFPIILYLGASGETTDKFSTKVCKFLGDISYPLYIVHYPFIYLYYGWVKMNDFTFLESIWGAIGVMVASILLAYACLKLYDIPVRRYLANKFLEPRKKRVSEAN